VKFKEGRLSQVQAAKGEGTSGKLRLNAGGRPYLLDCEKRRYGTPERPPWGRKQLYRHRMG